MRLSWSSIFVPPTNLSRATSMCCTVSAINSNNPCNQSHSIQAYTSTRPVYQANIGTASKDKEYTQSLSKTIQHDCPSKTILTILCTTASSLSFYQICLAICNRPLSSRSALAHVPVMTSFTRPTVFHCIAQSVRATASGTFKRS